MRKYSLVAAGLVAAANTLVAQQIERPIYRYPDAQPTIVTPGAPGGGGAPNAPGNPNDPRFRASFGNPVFDAVVSLRISFASGPDAGCTGSLLPNRRQILTAAHCVTSGSNVVSATSVRVGFMGADNSTDPFASTITVARPGVLVHPSYTGLVVATNDVAILNLPTEAPAFATTMGLFTGTPTSLLGQQITYVGFGSTGTGLTGDIQPGFAFTRRYGFNRLDVSANPGVNPNTVSFRGDANGGIWISDFDNGTSNGDSICRLPWTPSVPPTACNQGIPFDLNNPTSVGEVGIGRGDSGGPMVFNGQVVGIASFGGQFFANGFPQFGFGTIYGHANILEASNANWLRSVITPTNVVPEPGTYALMATGLVGLAGLARRRRTAA